MNYPQVFSGQESNWLVSDFGSYVGLANRWVLTLSILCGMVGRNGRCRPLKLDLKYIYTKFWILVYTAKYVLKELLNSTFIYGGSMSKKTSFIGLCCIFILIGIGILFTHSALSAQVEGETKYVYLPLIIKPMNYQTETDRSFWESSLNEPLFVEDFENDFADWGALAFPYETGNGFVLTGESSAQIIDSNLLPSGNHIHFRDWETGLTFEFPESTTVKAFGFDYRASEDWYVTFNDTETIYLPPSRPSFVGFVFTSEYPTKFTLWSDSHAQGGLTVDNISYVPIDAP